MVVSSDYDSTHEANHSDSSDVAHTEEDTEEGKNPAPNVILHPLIPPEVRRGRTTHTADTMGLSNHTKRRHVVTCIIHVVSIDHFTSRVTGQTDSGSRAVNHGGLRAFDESAKQLELSHLQHDGEDQWEMWTDPQSGELIREQQEGVCTKDRKSHCLKTTPT